MSRNILITGGAGFIGSHVVNHFVDKYPNDRIVVLDSLTYASNLGNLTGIEVVDIEGEPDKHAFFISNLIIEVNDIRNFDEVLEIFKEYDITSVIHLAAESHVDNSIDSPNIFLETNVMGTFNLLNAAKEYWGEGSENRFHHISTDEVYGDLSLDAPPFIETTPYNPSSPYSASKASSDHIVRAYGRTFDMNIVISNCSNNYGPHQHAEKLIPVVINKLIKGERIPVYGKGENIRDWLWVGDHVKAIDEIFHNGKSGHTYNVGGDNELTNLELINRISRIFKNEYREKWLEVNKLESYHLEGIDDDNATSFLEFVEDRKGHDLRYSVNSNKLQTQLNWKPEKGMEEGLRETIEYYVNVLS